MEVRVWYLYHSGFAVKTPRHFLVFDYWRDTPKGGLEAGVIDPEMLRDQDMVVFASHSHPDHYNPVIHSWKNAVPKLRIVLSDDIRARQDAIMVGANQTLQQPDFTLRTLKSTDQGVAFLLEIDGLRIYHAGDLNWWHWAGETPQYNQKMKQDYCREIDTLKDVEIDLAFVPVDPGLAEQYAWGIDYLMHTARVRYAVPMHFAGHPDIVDRLLRDPVTQAYRDRIVTLTKRGQSVELEGGN